jgi:hypothetical protein
VNRHQNRIAEYQVNCRLPRNPRIQIVAQKRNYTQSSYELDYEETDVPRGVASGYDLAYSPRTSPRRETYLCMAPVAGALSPRFPRCAVTQLTDRPCLPQMVLLITRRSGRITRYFSEVGTTLPLNPSDDAEPNSYR